MENYQKIALEEFLKNINVLDLDQAFTEMFIVELMQMKKALIEDDTELFFKLYKNALIRQNWEKIEELADEFSREKDNYNLIS